MQVRHVRQVRQVRLVVIDLKVSLNLIGLLADYQND